MKLRCDRLQGMSLQAHFILCPFLCCLLSRLFWSILGKRTWTVTVGQKQSRVTPNCPGSDRNQGVVLGAKGNVPPASWGPCGFATPVGKDTWFSLFFFPPVLDRNLAARCPDLIFLLIK